MASAFAQKFLATKGGVYRYLHGISHGRECWYILKLNPLQFQQYQHAIKQSAVDLLEFGEVLERGWGKDAPDSLLQHYKNLFG